MSKKGYIIIACIILACVITIISIIAFDKESKGYQLFGSEICRRSAYMAVREGNDDWDSILKYATWSDEDHPAFAGQAITKWKCAICGKEDTYHNTNVPKLCSECAEVTNRCDECGKKLYSK